MGRVLHFPGSTPPEDAPSTPTERDPVTDAHRGDVWRKGQSERTFDEYYCHDTRFWYIGRSDNGTHVRYRTPSGHGAKIPRAAWEAWCRDAELITDVVAQRLAQEDDERDHWRVAFNFVDYGILEADYSHLAALLVPTEKAKIQRLTRWWLGHNPTPFDAGGLRAHPQALALPPFGRYTFGWGTASVMAVLHEQDEIIDHKQARVAFWVCGLVNVRFEVEGQRWTVPNVPADLFRGDCSSRVRWSRVGDLDPLNDEVRRIAASNAPALHALWQATRAAAKLSDAARAAIGRPKGERALQPVLVSGDADEPPPPSRLA
jgi:hypothetical protein